MRWHKGWSKTMYLSAFDNFEKISPVLDSANLGNDSTFVFHLDSVPASQILFRLLLPKAGNTAGHYIENGSSDNYLMLPVQQGSTYRIQADADSFYYSALIKSNVPEINELITIRRFRNHERAVIARYDSFLDPKQSKKSRDSIVAIASKALMEAGAQNAATIMSYLDHSPVGWASLLALYEYNRSAGKPYAESVFRPVLDSFKGSEYVLIHRLTREMNRRLSKQIMTKLRDARLYTLKGKGKLLKDISDKVLLLDFWASWCQPCRVGIRTELKENYQLLLQHGITLVGVNTDKNLTAGAKAIKQDRPLWPQFFDNEKLGNRLGLQAIPAYLLIVPQNNHAEFFSSFSLALQYLKTHSLLP